MTRPTLADHIAALASEVPEFDRRARKLSTDNSLASILNEIDAAVLPVTMRFRAGESDLTLVASGRRLHRILDGAPDDVLNTPLSVDDAALTERAARALEAFAAGADTLTVTHEAPPAEMDMSDRVSVDALSAALGHVAEDANAPPLQRFLARMGDDVTAAIHLSNWVAGDMTGSASDLAALRIALTTQLSAFVETRAAQCASHSDPSLTVFADVAGTDASVGLAVFDDQAALFALQTKALPRAAECFQRLF